MRTDELKELEKLGFELSDLLPRLEMIQHASEAVTALNRKADNTTTALFCYQSSFEYLHANAKIER